MSEWIWLDSEYFDGYGEKSRSFCVAEFKKEYKLPIGKDYVIRICADTRYMLYVNGNFIGRGPASVGSDFVSEKMNYSYYDEYPLKSQGSVEIRAFVASRPTVMSEYSYGQSGFFAEIICDSEIVASTDSTWEARRVCSRISDVYTDYTVPELEFHRAKGVENIYNLKKCPLEHLDERVIFPVSLDKISSDTEEGYAVFDKIYSAYPVISLKTDKRTVVSVECSEIDGVGVFKETFVADKDTVHVSPRMRSVGQIKISLEGDGNAEIDDVSIIYSAYPVKNEAGFKCSDALLNDVFDLCIHTLKICRRDLHLDSPTHQEPLACTGDYYIQALMEYFNMYDPTLTKFDIFRTSQILEVQGGRMFHTTYSLIFAEWVYDYYTFTADKSVLYESERALRLLLERFDSYIGENGLLEKAPDYMFVDWILMDENGEHTDPTNMMSHGNFEGFSLHHPPKALGQSVLCMFYYNALKKCSSIFSLIGDESTASDCDRRACALKDAINAYLYDKERGLYVGGLNTPNAVPSGTWLPDNTERVFYLKQANTLAVLYGIAPCEGAKAILEYVVTDLKKEEMQPYFYHFLLSALIKENMFDVYGLNLIRRYESLLKRCNKGLCEAWETFPCDHSHAWGGTPAYVLKRALSGFEMLEAGYKRVKLSPRLFGLEYADFEISTPYGSIRIELDKDKKTIIAPDEIEIVEI